MPWKVKATAWNSEGPEYRTVLEIEDDEEVDLQQILYWIRNMDEGEKVVIKRFPSGESG